MSPGQMTSKSKAIFLCVAALLLSGPSLARTGRTVCNVAPRIEQSKAAFEKIGPSMLQARYNELSAAKRNLENFLKGSSQKRAEGWFDYLRWETFEKALSGAVTSDAQALENLLALYYKPHPGLEKKPVLQVRSKLRRYVTALRLHQNPSAEKTYGAKLSRLQRLLEGGLSAGEWTEAGSLTSWLSDTGLAPGIVQCLQTRYGAGNIHLKLSKNLIPNTLFSQIQQVTPIRQSISGASVTGRATTRARPRVRFVPNAREAEVQVVVDGQTVANTTSRQSRVSVGTRLVANHQSVKSLGFSGGQLVAGRTRVGTNTSASITGINTNRWLGRRIARRVAYRRASAKLPSAKRQLTNRISRQMRGRIDAQVSGVVEKANGFLTDYIRAPLQRIGFRPLLADSRTSSHSLFAGLRVSGPDQLGAPHTPAAPVAAGDLSAALHESLVTNMAAGWAAGRSLTDEKIVRYAKLFHDEVPAGLRVADGGDRWRVSLAERNPLVATFRDGTVTLVLNVEQLTWRSPEHDFSEAEAESGPYRVRVRYRPRIRSGLELIRRGEPRIEAAGESVTPRVKDFILKKVGALFPRRIHGSDIQLPSAISAWGRSLSFTETQARQGWFGVGWILR